MYPVYLHPGNTEPRCTSVVSVCVSVCVLYRYSIDRHMDMDRVFNIHAGNGSVFILRELDREENAWHNISVIATEFSKCRQTFPLTYLRVSYSASLNWIFGIDANLWMLCGHVKKWGACRALKANTSSSPSFGWELVFVPSEQSRSQKAAAASYLFLTKKRTRLFVCMYEAWIRNLHWIQISPLL